MKQTSYQVVRSLVPPEVRRPLGSAARSIIRNLFSIVLRPVVRHPRGVELLNRLYNPLSPRIKHLVWIGGAKMFVDSRPPEKATTWRLEVGLHPLILPLSPDRMWLDWDHALSVLGNDSAITKLYVDCIADESVDYFIDIGANYGTHSLIFLIAGVQTLTFEPNPQCAEVLRDYCAVNAVEPRLYHVALGEEPGSATLTFPTRETWLGTLVQGSGSVSTSADAVTVPVARLDDYGDEVSGRILVKIDVEGYELQVLRGARQFIRRHKPRVVFESNSGDPSRDHIFEFLTGMGYQVTTLPSFRASLSKVQLLHSPDTNFYAVPLVV